MRKTLFAALLLALPAAPPLTAQQGDPDRAAAGGGAMPAGWQARTDRSAPLAQVRFVTMGPGFHVTTGPAVVLYRDADTASGGYHAVATFTQTAAPRHLEAYGLAIGGTDLQGAGQRYTYFLIRGDGRFLVKRRLGDSTWSVSPGDTPGGAAGWTANAAVVKQDSTGKQTNELSILVRGDQVKFMVNGTEVLSLPAAQADTKGIVALRVNHNLDVHVAGFAVHRM